MNKKIALSVILGFAALTATARANIWLPNIFGDHMVLQAEKPVAIWGKASPGETVTVDVLDADGTVISSANVDAKPDKTWSVLLPAVPAERTVTVRLTGSESGEKTLSDVLIGEVWLLSGQSNMRWTVAKSEDADQEIAAADHPQLRLFTVKQNPAGAPLGNLNGEWQVCTPESVGDFSGAGYFFGRDLQKALDQPVGLILSAVGGTPIQAWIPRDAMDANPETAHIQTDYDAYFALPPAKREKARGTWIYGAKSEKGPGFLYNGMIHPLIPFTLRGIAWCQGEANDREDKWDGPSLYHTLFPMLITDWRERWGEGDLPFIYVELANFMASPKDPVDSGALINWAFIREAQASALTLPNVFAVSAIDVGEADDIHYKDKQTVGQRLALAALGQVYEQAESPTLSPRYESHTIEGNKIRLKFANAEGGLTTDDGQSPSAFAIRGEDGEWKWAQTEIDGGDILVWHDEIPAPTAVRHAWASNPDVNVYNEAKLPLMSFRTDAP